jgi:nanoRNase/pAp phosphatase (c-di-AMP/oligoRNAs hydrolase)
MFITDPHNWNAGEAAAAQLYEERGLVPGKDFDTLAGSSDLMTLGAIQYFERHGYYVPDDYKAVGFNNSEESRVAQSPLSTVHLPYAEMSKESLKILLGILNKKKKTQPDILLNSEMIIRESCGCKKLYYPEIKEIQSREKINEKYVKEEITGTTEAKIAKMVKETFIFDHHEPKPNSTVTGFIDSTAASTSEIAIELACHLNVELKANVAAAAYAGIVYDSGFFAYPKTNIRTFKAALKTLEWGVVPNFVYKQLMENSSYASMLLQKQALLNLDFYTGKKIAVIILRREDYETTGAAYDENENIASIPLTTKEVEVSILLKENPEGDIHCSLRSKGMVDVSKIAQSFNGGGHFNAAGFNSSLDTEELLEKVLKVVEAHLNL